jgi:hypothetical protein
MRRSEPGSPGAGPFLARFLAWLCVGLALAAQGVQVFLDRLVVEFAVAALHVQGQAAHGHTLHPQGVGEGADDEYVFYDGPPFANGLPTTATCSPAT